MQISKRVIQLAKERALFGFSMLAQNMVSEARYNLQRPSQSVRATEDSSAIQESAHFLARQGGALVERLQTYYNDYLDRAMQTMYRDLRTGLHNMSADRLSLIDDDTMNRQIEVDRLVVRMRDVDPENLGRVNLIIAQLHGDHNVRERENPFRPYLLARSLHEVLIQMQPNERVAKLLFDALAEVLLSRLPGYYAAIRDVFESNGVRSRLQARPASLTRRQRELLKQRVINPNFDVGQLPATLVEPTWERESTARIQTGLLRMLEAQKITAQSNTDDGVRPVTESMRQQALAFQEFVWQIFDQKRPTPLPRGPLLHMAPEVGDMPRATSMAMSDLLASELDKLQKEVATSSEGAEEWGRLATLRERLDCVEITPAERVTLDIVALLFEYIFKDPHLSTELRHEIGRLQVPFVKAAMLTPDLLKQPAHPARLLLNRLGAVSAALDTESSADREIFAKISSIIDIILARFEDDMSIFTECLQDFENFLRDHYRRIDPAAKLRIDAIEEAERTSVILFNFGNALRDLLTSVEIDRRVVDFITKTWSRVMAILMVRYAGDDAFINQYRVILPELVWSVTPGHTIQERNLLMRMLPELVKRLKKGLELAKVPEAECKEALDQLADVHMQILRGVPHNPAKKRASIEELYQHFSMLQICEGGYLWTEDEPLTVLPETVLAALDSREVNAELHIRTEAIPALAADEEWMTQMQLGIGAEIQIDKALELARLAWVGEQRALFVFIMEEGGQVLIYSSISLLKALRDGIVRPLEYAPLFDRAVESLMASAESFQIPS